MSPRKRNEAPSQCLLPLEEGDPSEASLDVDWDSWDMSTWQERLQSLVARVSDEAGYGRLAEDERIVRLDHGQALVHLLQYGYAIVDRPTEVSAVPLSGLRKYWWEPPSACAGQCASRRALRCRLSHAGWKPWQLTVASSRQHCGRS